MEKNYRRISYFFVALLIISLLGFFKSYLSKFPTFTGFRIIHHVHIISLLLWFGMLILQPVLIYAKQYRWHRILGRASYILIPVIVVLMIGLMKDSYLAGQSRGVSQKAGLAFLYIPVSAMIPFVILYVLAIYNRKKPAIHMRYMTGTAVAMLGAPIGRIDFGISDLTSAILFAFALADIFLAGLLVYEYFRQKNYKPYLVSLMICIFFHGLYAFLPSTDLWQGFAGLVVRIW